MVTFDPSDCLSVEVAVMTMQSNSSILPHFHKDSLTIIRTKIDLAMKAVAVEIAPIRLTPLDGPYLMIGWYDEGLQPVAPSFHSGEYRPILRIYSVEHPIISVKFIGELN